MSISPPCLPEETRASVTPEQPSPASLNYSLGLPGGAYCLATARTLVRHLLTEHGLDEMAELGVLAASELLGNACLFTPGRDAHLSLRWRYGMLRLTVFDEHPAHAAETVAACRVRRREALSTLDAVVATCGGVFGLEEARRPLIGSKMWVVFPREAARNYARL